MLNHSLPILYGTMNPFHPANLLRYVKRVGVEKSTTYTMLKRLCERGIFKNENGIVSSLMTKAEFGAAQSEKFVEDTFEGSLPAFLAAFTTRKN